MVGVQHLQWWMLPLEKQVNHVIHVNGACMEVHTHTHTHVEPATLFPLHCECYKNRKGSKHTCTQVRTVYHINQSIYQYGLECIVCIINEVVVGWWLQITNMWVCYIMVLGSFYTFIIKLPFQRTRRMLIVMHSLSTQQIPPLQEMSPSRECSKVVLN